MKIHIYHHIVQDCEIIGRLEEIISMLKELTNEKLKQEIMDKLVALQTDIEGTIS
jgi:hypothetical protein